MPRIPDALISAENAIRIRELVGKSEMPELRCPDCGQIVTLVSGGSVAADRFEHKPGAKECRRSDPRRKS